MKITLTITDTSDGGVSITSEPVPSELMRQLGTDGRKVEASTSACAYALGMLTHAAKASREMGRQQGLIVLPPGVRLG